MEKITSFFLNLTTKDWIIVASSILLALCFLQIRKLKKSLIREIRKRLIPQLNLELDLDALGIFLKNEGVLFAKDINIEDLAIDMLDYGFEMKFVLKFAEISSLIPGQRIRLEFKAFHQAEECTSDQTENIIPHLSGIDFKLLLNYSNIENTRFQAVIAKKGRKFYTERLSADQKIPYLNPDQPL